MVNEVYMCILSLDLLPAPDGNDLALPNFIILICGRDVAIPNVMEVHTLTLFCPVNNDTDLLMYETYKDGKLINESYSREERGFFLAFESPDNDVFGTYTFIVSDEKCGYAFAMSRILHSG